MNVRDETKLDEPNYCQTLRIWRVPSAFNTSAHLPIWLIRQHLKRKEYQTNNKLLDKLDAVEILHYLPYLWRSRPLVNIQSVLTKNLCSPVQRIAA